MHAIDKARNKATGSYIFSLLLVVTVEFQYSELTVSESECYLNVTVVKRGLTNHTVNVNFFTVDDNATGR